MTDEAKDADRLPPAPMATREQIAELKADADGAPLHFFRNHVGGWFGFKQPPIEACSRYLSRARGPAAQGDSADAEWVKTNVVYPDDATLRFRQLSGLITGLSNDLTGALGIEAGIQEFLEGELSEKQASIIVKNHGRARALKVLSEDYEGDFVFSDPTRPTVSALRRDTFNLSATAEHLRELCLDGDMDALIRNRPLAIYPLTIRLLNLVGCEEAAERKKF